MKQTTKEDLLRAKARKTWRNICRRCDLTEEKAVTDSAKELFRLYHNVTIVDEWRYFEKFYEWYRQNYRDGYVLDKDILIEGNRVYGPDTCCFVPNDINILMTHQRTPKKNGLPEGIRIGKDGYFTTATNSGRFETVAEAYESYRVDHISLIRKKTEEALLSGHIDERVASAMLQHSFPLPPSEKYADMEREAANMRVEYECLHGKKKISNSKRGGRREGAGRPATGNAQIPLGYKMDKTLHEKLPKNLNRNRYINNAVRLKMSLDGFLCTDSGERPVTATPHDTGNDNDDGLRKVVHVHYIPTGEHLYFGSIAAVFDYFTVAQLGVTYAYLKSYGLRHGKAFNNSYCIIRTGKLLQKSGKRGKHP